MHGHLVLSTPIRHCQLNAIGLIWAQVKGFVALHNTSFNIKDVESLNNERIKKVLRLCSYYSQVNFLYKHAVWSHTILWWIFCYLTVYSNEVLSFQYLKCCLSVCKCSCDNSSFTVSLFISTSIICCLMIFSYTCTCNLFSQVDQ